MQQHTPRLCDQIASSFLVHRLLLYLRSPASYVAAKPIPNRRYTAATVPSSPRCRTVSHTHACLPLPLTWPYTAPPEPSPSLPSLCYTRLLVRCFCPSLGRFIYPPPSAPLTVCQWPRPLIRGRLSPSGPQAMGQALTAKHALTAPFTNPPPGRPHSGVWTQSPVLCPLSYRPSPLYLGRWRSFVLKTASSSGPSRYTSSPL